MKLASIGKISGYFIEGMMCEGGCINGAGTIIHYLKARGIFNKRNVKTKKKSVLSNNNLERYRNISLNIKS